MGMRIITNIEGLFSHCVVYLFMRLCDVTCSATNHIHDYSKSVYKHINEQVEDRE